MPTPRAGKGLGYRAHAVRPALPTLAAAPPATLPPVVDLRSHFPQSVPDQGQFNTCTSNGGGAQFEYALARQGVAVPHRKSRAFNYYTAGVLEHDTSDDGRDPHYTFLAMQQSGLCDETFCPYDALHLATKPSAAAYTAAAHRHALSWAMVPVEIGAIKAALASGLPVGLAIRVYEGFEDDEALRTGVTHLPGPGERWLGDHWIVCPGYADVAQGRCPPGSLILRNSWGAALGDQGCWYVPEGFIGGVGPDGYALCIEAIALELVTGSPPAQGALPAGLLGAVA